MAISSLIFSCLVLSYIKASFAEPKFPKLPDDYSASGTMQLKIGRNDRFSMWYSKSLKSSRMDIKSYGQLDQMFELERQGMYGTGVFVESKTHGNKICAIVRGSAKHPMKYQSFFSILQNLEFDGVERVDGKILVKWLYTYQGYTGFVLIREDEHVPYIIDTKESRMQFEFVSSKPPSATVFKYDKRGCRRMSNSKRVAFQKIMNGYELKL